MRNRVLLLALIACIPPSCVPSEPFGRLAYTVVDAEYSRAALRVVLVSAGPPTLHLYDPQTRTDEEVSLPADPTCVALSADGRLAAVGHDRLLSYVDLTSGSLLRTYAVSAKVLDAVVPENGRVYAFLETGGTNPQISVLNVATGAEQIVTGGGARAMQRPDTDTIYVINNAVNPESLGSLDIGGGGAVRLHGSPYRGSHPPCGELWFSEDGHRIFTACGETFRASSSRDQDMRFVGALQSAARVQSLDHSAVAQHVVAIPAPGMFGDPLTDTRLQIYHDLALEYRGFMPLPSFVQDGQAFPAHGRFVFFDEGAHNLIVVQQADPEAGLQQDFAIYTFAFNPSVFVSAPASPPPPMVVQPFRSFDRPIEDAEWNFALDRIVFVSSDPHLLHVYDPETGEDRTVPVPFAPNSVSVAPAGDRAAVGHDGGRISLVDLTSATLLTTYSAYGDVLDVVLTPDRIYEFPRSTSGNGDLRAVEVATGAQERTVAVGVGGDSKATTDVTGAFLHIVPSYLSGDKLEKVDISQRPPVYVRGLIPHPEEQGFCGALWRSAAGQRLFTRCGAVYRSSTIPAVDLTVEGRLIPVSPARHISDSITAGAIAAIPGIPDYDGFGFAVLPSTGWNGDRSADTRVKLFDANTLAFVGDVALTPFTLVSGTAAARGRFVFFDRAGARIHVIVEADPASGVVNGFGIQSFDAF